MAELYNWNELAKESPRHGIERVAFRGDDAIIQGRTRLHVGDEVFECGPAQWCACRRTWCITPSRSATRCASTSTCTSSSTSAASS